jgi:hypothetical protein
MLENPNILENITSDLLNDIHANIECIRYPQVMYDELLTSINNGFYVISYTYLVGQAS